MKTVEILEGIENLSEKIKREIILMEVCGTHTEVIAKHTIKKALPKNIKLISGPGCPVCVTDQQDIDNVIELAQNNIPLAIFGDTLKVPGTKTSLDKMRSLGKDITVIYNPEECLKLKKDNLVFFGIGFETTAPTVAYIIKNGIDVYSSCKVFPVALSALLSSKETKIDGLIDPGHVSAIVGTSPYKKNKIPQVISGFALEDILISILLLLKQISKNTPKLQNQYSRLVKPEGNKKALKLLDEVFEKKDALWRGFGNIPLSGYEISQKFKNQDAKKKYASFFKNIKTKQKNPCRCDRIILGLEQPKNCPLFEKICSPENPQGACMVSSEGACNISYRYE